jgi:2-keto-4-pentenoate hydratase/2-oxohepta-3-ene-1,7-dioic acid hydratase in catechol pathway
MKFIKIQKGDRRVHAVLDGDTVEVITASPQNPWKTTGEKFKLSEGKLLAPIEHPGKMLALALNYGSHLHGAQRPSRPEPFYKNYNSIIGPEVPIVLPKDAGKVDMEAELVAVIGKEAKNVSESDALKHVLGYTCGNDVSAREWQSGPTADKQWWRAKSADTFGPIGPAIATDLEPQSLTILGRVNGKEGQRCNTAEMIFGVRQAISFISRYVTLNPGDMLWTGTSGSTPQLKAGDVVEIEISGIGVLRNPVKSA